MKLTDGEASLLFKNPDTFRIVCHVTLSVGILTEKLSSFDVNVLYL